MVSLVCGQVLALLLTACLSYLGKESSGVLDKAQCSYFRHFDVPGIFARDFQKLTGFASNWYANGMPGVPKEVSVSNSNAKYYQADDLDPTILCSFSYRFFTRGYRISNAASDRIRRDTGGIS